LVLIRNEGNLGFTGGNYVATHCALRRERLVDYVFLLNNNAKVHPDCLSHLVLVDRKTDSGIIGAVILDETGSYVMFTGGWPRYVSFSIHSCLGIFLLLKVALSIGGRPGSPAQEC
jgi:GT2 family glycosyltransferase